MDGGQVVGVMMAISARIIICDKELFWKKGAVYNLVDMLVSSWMSKYLLAENVSDGSEDKDYHVCRLLSSRVVGVISGLAVTAIVCGPIDPVMAIALNTGSLVGFFFFDFAIQRIKQDPFSESRTIWYP